MNAIAQYLEKTKTSQSDFAALIDVTPSAVYQYVTERRPVSEKVCVRIEQRTGGGLSRQALRPNDWHQIWPELSGEAHV